MLAYDQASLYAPYPLGNWFSPFLNLFQNWSETFPKVVAYD
jgi:hypothetical protein